MSLVRRASVWLVGLLIACLALPSSARAQADTDPVRLIPASADFVLKVPQPRRLVEVVAGLDALQQYKNLEALRELYDSTNARRLYQLVDYFETRLGHKNVELLDRVAGGGIAL